MSRLEICVVNQGNPDKLKDLLSNYLFHLPIQEQNGKINIVDASNNISEAELHFANSMALMPGTMDAVVRHAHILGNLSYGAGRNYLIDTLRSSGLDPGDTVIFVDVDAVIDSSSWLNRLISPLRRLSVGITGIANSDHFIDLGICAFRGEVFWKCEYELLFQTPLYADIDLADRAEKFGYVIKPVEGMTAWHRDVMPPTALQQDSQLLKERQLLRK